MTDTTRPEWMPTQLSILEMQDGDYTDEEIDKAFNDTGLRAQIAVLEEIWNEMPSENFEEDEPLYRKDTVFLKIAALRNELSV